MKQNLSFHHPPLTNHHMFAFVTGYAIAVGVTVAISFVAGALAYFMVKDKAENFFVAGHSLPLWLVAVTLAAQSVDSNALLGNVDLAYKFQFWDGACT